MSRIDKLRDVELELLKELIRVCVEHNLKWYAFFGTLLGAMRDEGFLLWDDDVDIAMPAEDYNRLCTNKDWFGDSYFLQTPLDVGRPKSVKLRKNGTTAFSKDFISTLRNGGHLGICIDILPLDEYADPNFYQIGNSNSSPIFPKSLFEPAKRMKFENLEVFMPAKFRKIAELSYPNGWAWPYGSDDPKPHYWFFDTQNDYSIYVRRFTGMMQGIVGKKILLFGAADSLKVWLNYYENYRNQVICTFDNDANKWGTEAFGVEVRNPAELPKLKDENTRVIIVSLWNLEIGRQIEDMGINDYYIFVDGWKYTEGEVLCSKVK